MLAHGRCNPTAQHWGRLLDEALHATAPRVGRPELLRRTHAIDVLERPKYHGRLRVVAAVMDRASVAEVFGRLGLVANERPTPSARDPTAAATS